MAGRGRPPSAKTLVDRQLGRNIKHQVLPAGDGFIIPNSSGVEDFNRENGMVDWNTTNLKVDHIAEKTGGHNVVFDNNLDAELVIVKTRQIEGAGNIIIGAGISPFRNAIELSTTLTGTTLEPEVTSTTNLGLTTRR